MTPKVVRWRGGPGSGKTYQLLEFIRTEIEQGRNTADIAVMTFSRSQAADLLARIGGVASRESGKGLEIRTIHGTALQACIRLGLLDMKVAKVISPGDLRHTGYYKDFCKLHDLPFRAGIRADDLEEAAVAVKDLPPGNVLFMLWAYLQSTLHESDAWEIAAADLGVTFPGYLYDVPGLLTAWQTYKAERNLLEHEDYVNLALREEVPPPAPVLVVDEYQDVSPAQDALIRHWIEHPDTRRIYLAGDEDQSIYGFRGCNPTLFLSHDAEDRGSGSGTDRPVSRRCPRSVMTIAEKILGHPPNAAPCDREGFTATVVPATADDLSWQIEEGVIRAGRTSHRGADVFVLSRYGHTVQELSKVLYAVGLPHTSIRGGRITRWGTIRLGHDSKHLERETVDLWALTCSIRKIRDGGDLAPLTLTEAGALTAALVAAPDREKVIAGLKAKHKKTKQITAMDALLYTHGAVDPGILDALNIRQEARSAISACLRREDVRGFVIHPDQVRIDTCHASKGLEAPVVLLHTAFLKSRMPSLLDEAHAAEERRVFFVAATRASDALLFLDGLKGNAVTAPVLQGVL